MRRWVLESVDLLDSSLCCPSRKHVHGPKILKIWDLLKRCFLILSQPLLPTRWFPEGRQLSEGQLYTHRYISGFTPSSPEEPEARRGQKETVADTTGCPEPWYCSDIGWQCAELQRTSCDCSKPPVVTPPFASGWFRECHVTQFCPMSC